MIKNILITIVLLLSLNGCIGNAIIAENQTTSNTEMQAKVDHNNSTPVLNNNQR